MQDHGKSIGKTLELLVEWQSIEIIFSSIQLWTRCEAI